MCQPFVAVIFLLLAAQAHNIHALSILSTEALDGSPNACLSINVTVQEFYALYASTFRMSDGSSIKSVASTAANARVKYMQELMKAVAVTVAVPDRQTITLQACGKDVMDILLLAVVGNFVTNPGVNALPWLVIFEGFNASAKQVTQP